MVGGEEEAATGSATLRPPSAWPGPFSNQNTSLKPSVPESNKNLEIFENALK